MVVFTNFILEQWPLFTLLSFLLVLWLLLEKKHGIGRLNPQQAVIAMNSERLTVVDTRATTLFDAGHINSAINIPYKNSNFQANIAKHKDSKILVACDKGLQSKAIASQLNNKGFNCISLSGGMSSWQLDGFPVISGKNKTASLSKPKPKPRTKAKAKTAATKPATKPATKTVAKAKAATKVKPKTIKTTTKTA